MSSKDKKKSAAKLAKKSKETKAAPKGKNLKSVQEVKAVSSKKKEAKPAPSAKTAPKVAPKAAPKGKNLKSVQEAKVVPSKQKETKPAPSAKTAPKVAPKAAPKGKESKSVQEAKVVPSKQKETKPAPSAKTAPKVAPKGKESKSKESARSSELVESVVAKPHEEKHSEKQRRLAHVVSEETSVLLKKYKLLRTPFFYEVVESEDRNSKKKFSSETKTPEKPTTALRNRSSLVEESPEELIERLAQELEEENMGLLREFGQQICTKCGINPVTPEFRVDKDLGYCEECADLLRLGQSKEARKADYQMSLMRRDPLADDEDSEEEPDDADLEDEDLDEDLE